MSLNNLCPYDCQALRVRPPITDFVRDGLGSFPDIYSIQFSEDSSNLCCGTGDGRVRVFNSASGRALAGYSHSCGYPVSNVVYSPRNNGVILSCCNKEVLHHHVSSNRDLSLISFDDEIYCVEYNHDGTLFAAAGKKPHISIYDENTSSLVFSLSEGDGEYTAGHTDRIFGIAFHPTNPNLMVSGGWDRTVQIWDFRCGYSVSSISGVNVCGNSLRFSPDGSTLIVGSWSPTNPIVTFDFRNTLNGNNDTLNRIVDRSRAAESIINNDINKGETLDLNGQSSLAFGRSIAKSTVPDKVVSAYTKISKECKVLSWFRVTEEELEAREQELRETKEKTATQGRDIERLIVEGIRNDVAKEEENDNLDDDQAEIDDEASYEQSEDYHIDLITEEEANGLDIVKRAQAYNPTLVYSLAVCQDQNIPILSACGSGGNEGRVLNYKNGEILGGIRLPGPAFATTMSKDGRFCAYAGVSFGVQVCALPLKK